MAWIIYYFFKIKFFSVHGTSSIKQIKQGSKTPKLQATSTTKLSNKVFLRILKYKQMGQIKLQLFCNSILWEEAKEATCYLIDLRTGLHRAHRYSLETWAGPFDKLFSSWNWEGFLHTSIHKEGQRFHGKSEKVEEVYKLSKVPGDSSLEIVLCWRETAGTIIQMKGERS